jgi:DNA polymerase III subunit gamma/tau
MSYTVLARRYRSATFDQVIGQEQVARTLKKAIETSRVAHAYLFCGARGTGKTSTARILAKCLNCLRADAATITPCNECDSCVAIARGEDIDVIEIDAASHTGVDNVREIIANAHFRPARARFKVYIIDEVHMLSKNAFNALLKTLEEPPSHVKFILATTEPEKVLATILSRCQRYDFRNISTKEIAAHLQSVCRQEKMKADDDALLLAAKCAAGSMRDGLSLLERLLSSGEERLTAGVVEQLLGLPRAQSMLELAEAIGQADVGKTLAKADAILAAGMSADALLAALAEHLRNLLILRTCGAESGLVEAAAVSMEEMQRQAQRFDPLALTQDIPILEELRRQLRQGHGGRALLDATLVRLALAEQFTSIGELLSRVDGAGAATEKKKSVSEPVRPHRFTPAPDTAAFGAEAQARRGEAANPDLLGSRGESASKPSPKAESPSPSSPEPSPRATSVPPAAAAAVPAQTRQPMTPELLAELRKDPLASAVMDELGGNPLYMEVE